MGTNRPASYAHQFSLTLESEIPPRTVARISYIGGRQMAGIANWRARWTAPPPAGSELHLRMRVIRTSD
jgi:acyl dehydratase